MRAKRTKKKKKKGDFAQLKLIDFAHTKLTPGRGKDEGVILGLDTTLRLLRGRLEEVQ